jgi:hypothetical protein
MIEVELRKLGVDPTVEAVLLQELYTGDGVDSLVRSEFPETVFVYGGASQSDIRERITKMYCGEVPNAVGTLALIKGRPIGMAFSGLKDVRISQNGETISRRGVNLSGWVSKEYRNQGAAKLLLGFNVMVALNQMYVSAESNWLDRILWTSIDDKNNPSKRVSGLLGFKRLQPDISDRARSVYLHTSSSGQDLF